jgi:hypothetical protein
LAVDRAGRGIDPTMGSWAASLSPRLLVMSSLYFSSALASFTIVFIETPTCPIAFSVSL